MKSTERRVACCHGCTRCPQDVHKVNKVNNKVLSCVSIPVQTPVWQTDRATAVSAPWSYYQQAPRRVGQLGPDRPRQQPAHSTRKIQMKKRVSRSQGDATRGRRSLHESQLRGRNLCKEICSCKWDRLPIPRSGLLLLLTLPVHTVQVKIATTDTGTNLVLMQ